MGKQEGLVGWSGLQERRGGADGGRAKIDDVGDGGEGRWRLMVRIKSWWRQVQA